MPEIFPDLSEVEAQTTEPGIAFGAEIVSATPTTAKTSGAAMLEVELRVNVNGKDRTRYTNVMISGKGAFRFLQLLRAAGFGDVAKQLANGEKPHFTTEQLEGQRIGVVFKTGEYQGEPRDEVDKFVARID